MDSKAMQPPAQQPLGFWAVRAGEAVGRRTQGRLAEIGLTQPEWWVLQQLSLHPPGTGRSQLLETLGPSVGAERLDDAILAAASRGWLTESHSILRLTAAGEEQFQRAADVQRALADERMQGISDDELATTITVLQRTVRNVGGEAWHW